MDFSGIISNLTSPALLFFLLGIIVVQVKSDLEIPKNSSKFISIYLLFSIGFKGGQELSHSVIGNEVIANLALSIALAVTIPVLAFFILKTKLGIENAGAIAASYGSVSAVTFVTCISFLHTKNVMFDGYMIASMALMEAPAIIIALLLIKFFNKEKSKNKKSISNSIRHSLTNGSVILIIGSLIIGYLANAKQAEGISPFTTDIFEGFLAVFLLDMGITSGKQLSIMFKKGVFPFLFSSIMPFFNGIIALFISSMITDNPGNQLLFSILGASASYIAVPAAMKHSVPKANPSLYLPMALGITFPINVIIGIPFYYWITTLIN